MPTFKSVTSAFKCYGSINVMVTTPSGLLSSNLKTPKTYTNSILHSKESKEHFSLQMKQINNTKMQQNSLKYFQTEFSERKKIK